MQNRYFGDVGDYGKYGLLRKLCGLTSKGPQLSLGVVWYLAPDEGHNSDGMHISYLQKEEYRSCDPDLFDGLNALLQDGVRAVSKIQKSNLLSRKTTYFDDPLSFEGMPIIGTESREARLEHRRAWLLKASQAVKEKDVVFLDPDNGFQVKSVQRHANKGVKYVYWDEVEEFVVRGSTPIIYHHLNRTMKSRDQIQIKLEEFKKNLPDKREVFPVLFKRGSHRVFFVLPSKENKPLIKARLEEMQNSAWETHIEIFGL